MLDAVRHLSGQALRHRAAHDRARGRGASAPSWPSGSPSCARRGQAARGAAARVAHQLRHRDAARDRHLRRHRELLAPPDRPRGRASGPPASSTTSPTDFLVVVDESHVTLPQIGGMYNGDRARKLTLVEYGFRLPSRARQPAAAVRRVHGAGAADDQRLGHAGRARAAALGAAWSSSRSSGRPAWSIRRSRSGRCAARWTTC